MDVFGGDRVKGLAEVDEGRLDPSFGNGRQVVNGIREKFRSEGLAFVFEAAVPTKVGERRFGYRLGGREELLPCGGSVGLAGCLVPIEEPGMSDGELVFLPDGIEGSGSVYRDRGGPG